MRDRQPPGRRLRGDERAASITLSYVIAIAIATVLVTGLFIAGGNFVDRQQDAVVRNELSVVGQRLASDIERVDRLVVAGRGDTTVRLNQSTPTTTAGTRYDVRLVTSGSPAVVLDAEGAGASVSVPVSNRTPLGAASVDSGATTVVYTGTNITIREAD
jgi:hypothetical protein